MENKKHINLQGLLEGVVLSKAKYIEVLDEDEDPLYKMELLLDDEDMVDFLDNLFDRHYTVIKISKENFDSFEGTGTLDFNL